MYRKVSAMNRKIFGDEHPRVAADLNNLAWLLKAQVSFFYYFLF